MVMVCERTPPFSKKDDSARFGLLCLECFVAQMILLASAKRLIIRRIKETKCTLPL